MQDEASPPPPDEAPRSLPRSVVIDLLRQRCLALVDDEHSLCEVAARLKILCGGFSQWTSGELKERYEWIARNRPGITRRELEELANRWQLARQEVLGTELACDTQMLEGPHKVCSGWDDHSNEDLARFWHELSSEPIQVLLDPEVGSNGQQAG